ncbi:MAG: hypothetical protein HRU21_11490, partial [Pseudomonadales bacterium]|nr:hypothetical protein [Pseudomonadales bacterium]
MSEYQLQHRLYLTAAEVLAVDICGLDHFHRQSYKPSDNFVPGVNQPMAAESVQTQISYMMSQLTQQLNNKPIAQLFIIADQSVKDVIAASQVFEHGFAMQLEYANSVVDALAQFDQSELTNAAILAIDNSFEEANEKASEDATTQCADIARHISFSESFTAYPDASGLAAIVLDKSLDKDQFYLSSIEQAILTIDDAILNQTALTEYLHQQHDLFQQVALIETSSVNCQEAEQEAIRLSNAYQSRDSLSIAVASVKALLGNGGSFTDLAAIIHASLCCQQRYLAGVSNWQKPASSSWYSSPFYFATESRPWYLENDHQQRVAAVNLSHAHLFIADNPADTERLNGFLSLSHIKLFPVFGNSEQELLACLNSLKQQLAVGLSTNPHILYELRNAMFQQALAGMRESVEKGAVISPDADYIAVLLAENSDELFAEIEKAESGIADAFANKAEWKTPKGSYFTAQSVNAAKQDAGLDSKSSQDNVCFLYPGIGATYVGIGRDLFQLFPEIYHQIDLMADSLIDSMKDRIINPRSIDKLGFKELKEIDSSLRNHLADIAECGVAYAVIFTRILQAALGVKADFAAGYSMGEISMFAGLGCWQKPGLMSERLAESDTFNERLSGDLKALKAHWGMPENAAVKEKLWETYTLKATPEAVAKAA